MLRCRLVVALGSAILGASGCPGFGDKVVTSGVLEPPTYVESVQPLLERRCLSCHGGEQRVRADFRLDRCEDGDDGVKGARAMRQTLLEQVSSDAMPRGQEPLSPAEKKLLSSWAETGGACEPGYAEHVRPLFTAYCIDCHGVGTPRDPTTPDTLRLDRCTTTPELGGALAASDAAEEIRIWLDDPSGVLMPPLGEEPQPSRAEVDRILLWIGRGAPCAEDDDGSDAGPESP